MKVKGVNSDLLAQLRMKEDELTALRNSYDQFKAQSITDMKRGQDANAELLGKVEKSQSELQN